MKKSLFLFVAVMVATLFSACKVDTADVRVTVYDQDTVPVANRKVYAIDLATAIIDVVAPAPEEPFCDDNGVEYEHRTTNAQGTTTFTFTLLTKSLRYMFYVPDLGTESWVSETVKVERGGKQDVVIYVNK